MDQELVETCNEVRKKITILNPSTTWVQNSFQPKLLEWPKAVSKPADQNHQFLKYIDLVLPLEIVSQVVIPHAAMSRGRGWDLNCRAVKGLTLISFALTEGDIESRSHEGVGNQNSLVIKGSNNQIIS